MKKFVVEDPSAQSGITTYQVENSKYDGETDCWILAVSQDGGDHVMREIPRERVCYTEFLR